MVDTRVEATMPPTAQQEVDQHSSRAATVRRDQQVMTLQDLKQQTAIRLAREQQRSHDLTNRSDVYHPNYCDKSPSTNMKPSGDHLFHGDHHRPRVRYPSGENTVPIMNGCTRFPPSQDGQVCLDRTVLPMVPANKVENSRNGAIEQPYRNACSQHPNHGYSSFDSYAGTKTNTQYTMPIAASSNANGQLAYNRSHLAFHSATSEHHSLKFNRVSSSVYARSESGHSHQSKSSKLPHGLTVQELKEMTRARLAAEAKQKDEPPKFSDRVDTSFSSDHSFRDGQDSRSTSSVSSLRTNNTSQIFSEAGPYERNSSAHSAMIHEHRGGTANTVHNSVNSSFRRVSSLTSDNYDTSRAHCDYQNGAHVFNSFKHYDGEYLQRPASASFSSQLGSHQSPSPSMPSEFYQQDVPRSKSFPFSGRDDNSFVPSCESPSPFVRNSQVTRTLHRGAFDAQRLVTSDEQSGFIPNVPLRDSFVTSSFGVSRVSSPSDSRTDDRSSLLTESGWFDIFGRPSSTATIPTVEPSSESFGHDDDNYTLTFSPEPSKVVYATVPLSNCDSGMLTRIQSISPGVTNSPMSMNGVFRAIQLDSYEPSNGTMLLQHCSSTVVPLSNVQSPFRMKSEFGHDSSFLRSLTGSFAEEDAFVDSTLDDRESDGFPITLLENDLNNLLTISNETGTEKKDFLVSKIDPEYVTNDSAHLTSAVLGASVHRNNNNAIESPVSHAQVKFSHGKKNENRVKKMKRRGRF